MAVGGRIVDAALVANAVAVGWWWTPPAAPNTGSDGLVLVTHGDSYGVASIGRRRRWVVGWSPPRAKPDGLVLVIHGDSQGAAVDSASSSMARPPLLVVVANGDSQGMAIDWASSSTAGGMVVAAGEAPSIDSQGVGVHWASSSRLVVVAQQPNAASECRWVIGAPRALAPPMLLEPARASLLESFDWASSSMAGGVVVAAGEAPSSSSSFRQLELLV
ncbi:hypothetical protein BJ912DRAFT_1114638 [Pholiota molesta]|nr:hypothetical protein BJ912DRAFT_1114638 [Pholiota molesta]